MKRFKILCYRNLSERLSSNQSVIYSCNSFHKTILYKHYSVHTRTSIIRLNF